MHIVIENERRLNKRHHDQQRDRLEGNCDQKLKSRQYCQVDKDEHALPQHHFILLCMYHFLYRPSACVILPFPAQAEIRDFWNHWAKTPRIWNQPNRNHRVHPPPRMERRNCVRAWEREPATPASVNSKYFLPPFHRASCCRTY